MSSLLHIDLVGIIVAVGYIGLFAIVFAESGLFFGFFFPGDSLLFTAGLLASQNIFTIWLLLPLLTLAGVLGDNVGYWFGAKVGPSLFTRDDSLFFHKKHLERTRLFYEKYGSFTIVLARFVPIVRTFAPIFAGVGRMHYGTFFLYNILGGVLWSVGITLLGFFLGNAFPGTQDYLLPITLGIILLSCVPLIREWRKNKH